MTNTDTDTTNDHEDRPRQATIEIVLHDKFKEPLARRSRCDKLVA